MPGYATFRSLQVFGATVHVHWSVFVVVTAMLVASIRDPAWALIGVGCYLAVIVLHEAGHAYLSRRLGYQPFNIYLGFAHGCCETETPDTLRDECIIAWGGVLAQLAVAVPLIAVGQLTSLAEYVVFGPLIGFLGYISALVALMNLAPARGFDGHSAWRLIPLLFAEHRRSANAKRSVRQLIRRIKRR